MLKTTTHASFALLTLIGLAACGVSTPQAVTKPPPPSTARPTPPVSPTVPFAPVAGIRVFGKVAVSLGDAAGNVQPQALGDDLASFTRVLNGTFDVGNTRYFFARFAVRNNSSTAFSNLTLYAQHVRGQRNETVSQSETAFKSLRNAGGLEITDSAVIRSILPGQRVRLDNGNLVQVDADADFQAVTPNEAQTVEGEGLSRGALGPFDHVLEYGFVARNASGGRSIAPGGDGTVTLTFRIPIQSSAALMPSGFTLNAVVADVTTGRVTRGELETTAQAQTRAANIGGITELALVGSDDTVNGFTKIYRLALAMSYDASSQATRDPWLQPFNRRSVWNMPLGANASIQSVGAFNPGTAFPTGFSGFGADTELHFHLRASDPLRNLYDPKSWTERCGGTGQQSPGFQMRVPDGWLIADAIATPTQYSTPNNVSAFLQPDRDTVFELEPLARCANDPNVYGYRNTTHPEASLRLDTGNFGTHFGSGLSGFGGSLRHGDLTSTAPIGHALHFNVWGKKFLNFNAATATPGYRWPADRADGGAGSGPNAYGGTDPKIEQGALLAIPVSTALTMKTAAGAKMLQALRGYGAYITDDTGWDHYDWGVSKEALEEFREVYGYGFEQGSSASGAAKDWYDDMVALIAALGVVDDNAPDNIGGAGPRRVPVITAEYAPFDADPPSVPSNLSLTSAGVSSLSVQWSASSDAHRVVRYDLLNAAGAVVSSTYGATSATVQNLTPNTAYGFSVRAVDGNGNESAGSGPLQASTKLGYAANFNLAPQPGWSLSAYSSVAGGALNQGDWCCANETSVYSAGVTSGSYTLETDFVSFGTGVGNEGWLYFNYQDANNYDAVKTSGSGSSTLVKAVNGAVTTLGSAAYSFTGGARVRIAFDKPTHRIVVSSTRDGTMTPLFDTVDSAFDGGGFGFGSAYNKVRADNLTLEGTLGAARFFRSDFTGNTAPGWTLSAGTVLEYDHLKTGSFGAFDSSLHAGPDGESFTFSADLELYGDGYYNEGLMYFNASNANNGYALRFNGSGSQSANGVLPNIVELLKIVGGNAMVLSSAAAGFSFQGTGARVKIGFDAANHRIVVQAARGGVTTALFDVVDTTYNGGQLGFVSRYSGVVADNVEVKLGLDLAIPVFTSNFDAGSDPGWTLSDANSQFQYGRLRVGNYGASSGATHAGTTAGSYVFSGDLFTYASASSQINSIFFNQQDANNTYVIEMTSETSNTLTFKKRVAGVETVLGTASNYPIQNNTGTARFNVRYDAPSHSFTVDATRGGTTTILFSAVSDVSFSAGRVGFGALNGQLDVDNVSLSQ